MQVKSKSADGLHEIIFDEGPHIYTLDGNAVPGVTTFNKEGYPESIYLSMWKAGEAGKFAINALLSYLATASELKEDEIEKIVRSSKRAWMVPSKAAASIGTVVHDYAYADSNGLSFDDQVILQHPGRQKILGCIALYKEWASKDVCEKVASEQVVGSARLWFAGKFDRLDRMPNGKLRLRDYKTSTGIYLDMFMQMAAYKIAIREWLGDEVNELEVIRFGKEGDFEAKTSMQYAEQLEMTHEQFLSNLEKQVVRNKETYDFRHVHEV